MHASFETIDDQPALRFERRLAHPVEKVWRAVAEPEQLGEWFPCAVEIDDMRVGARMRFTFPDDIAPPIGGEVLELDPPRRFSFLWGEEDRILFDLEPADDGCVLRFTHFLDTRDKAARDAAGWEVCLATLDDVLDGKATEKPGTRPIPAWRDHYEAYERRGFPTGAPVPD